MTGIERIAAERKRQIEEEGWTSEYDDSFMLGELADAAACYAMDKIYRDFQFINVLTVKEKIWPWYHGKFKPTPGNRIRELEKAGALIAAEIDRLLRAEKKAKDDLQGAGI
jgi:hypothetical protein